MRIKLKLLDAGVLFEAETARGHRVRVEGARELGGTDSAPSPMEYLLISQMGCTAIDITEMLRKMRQPLVHLAMDAEAQRAEDQVPRVFNHIHLHYVLYGAVSPEKAARAIDMSVNRYCTVSKMIDRVARITTSFEILPPAEAPGGSSGTSHRIDQIPSE
jgi:putative redox protein